MLRRSDGLSRVDATCCATTSPWPRRRARLNMSSSRRDILSVNQRHLSTAPRTCRSLAGGCTHANRTFRSRPSMRRFDHDGIECAMLAAGSQDRDGEPRCRSPPRLLLRPRGTGSLPVHDRSASPTLTFRWRCATARLAEGSCHTTCARCARQQAARSSTSLDTTSVTSPPQQVAAVGAFRRRYRTPRQAAAASPVLLENARRQSALTPIGRDKATANDCMTLCQQGCQARSASNRGKELGNRADGRKSVHSGSRRRRRAAGMGRATAWTWAGAAPEAEVFPRRRQPRAMGAEPRRPGRQRRYAPDPQLFRRRTTAGQRHRYASKRTADRKCAACAVEIP